MNFRNFLRIKVYRWISNLSMIILKIYLVKMLRLILYKPQLFRLILRLAHCLRVELHKILKKGRIYMIKCLKIEGKNQFLGSLLQNLNL